MEAQGGELLQVEFSPDDVPTAVRGEWNATLSVAKGFASDRTFRGVMVRVTGLRSREYVRLLAERFEENMNVLLTVPGTGRDRKSHKPPALMAETVRRMVRVELAHLPLRVDAPLDEEE